MKKRFTEEQIVKILQEAERSHTDQEVIRKHNISDTTFYRWKKLYGGMGVSEVKRLKELEAENAKLKILVVVDEYTRECLALEEASIRAHHLIDTLSRLMTLHGRPKFIRSDNGPEFTAKALIEWLTDNQIGPAFIKPGSPWQNAYVESFNGKFRDECLSREWFLQPQRCTGHDRMLAAPLQSRAASQLAR